MYFKKVSQQGILPNGYGRSPQKGKVFIKKNKSLLLGLEITIKENTQAMSKFAPGSYHHNLCKEQIQTAIEKRNNLLNN